MHGCHSQPQVSDARILSGRNKASHMSFEQPQLTFRFKTNVEGRKHTSWLTEKLESKTHMGHSIYANLKRQESNNILAMFLENVLGITKVNVRIHDSQEEIKVGDEGQENFKCILTHTHIQRGRERANYMHLNKMD